MRGHLPVAVLLGIAPLAPAAALEGVPRKEVPFPFERSVILNEEKVVYTVEGRARIRKGVNVTCQKEVWIRAKGSAPAVIEVEGTLQTRGVATREVIFEGVTIEPCAQFENLRLDMTWFRNGGGVKTPEGVAVEGEQIFVELCGFMKGAGFDVVVQRGEVTLSSICTDGPTRVRGVKPPGAKESRVQVFARGSGDGGTCRCHGASQGFGGGLEVEGGNDMMVQLSRTGGALTAVRNWGKRLLFNGMKVNSPRLEITHVDPGMMARAQVTNLDVYSGEVVASAPRKEGQKDTLVMDRCWFKGLKDPKEILSKVVKDGEDDPEKNGVRVSFPKVDERAHELAGPLDR